MKNNNISCEMSCIRIYYNFIIDFFCILWQSQGDLNQCVWSCRLYITFWHLAMMLPYRNFGWKMVMHQVCNVFTSSVVTEMWAIQFFDCNKNTLDVFCGVKLFCKTSFVRVNFFFTTFVSTRKYAWKLWPKNVWKKSTIKR